jgi:hypothetical protein
MRVVLVQPPFFRLVGSHNDRGPLELAYLAAALRFLGSQPKILNLDRTGAAVHCTWADLYSRSAMLTDAICDRSPVLFESAEIVLGENPDAVVISAGDSITPWVDLGNGWISARLGAIISSQGIPTYVIGPRSEDPPDQMVAVFKRILTGMTFSDAACLIAGVTPSSFDHAEGVNEPLISVDEGFSRWDVVMSSLGCVKACSFCDAAKQRYRMIEPATFAADVRARTLTRLDLGDAIFMPAASRLDELSAALDEVDCRQIRFSCELSVDMVNPRRLALLVSFGVTEVKLGIESADDDALQVMRKRHDARCIRDACKMVNDAGMKLTIYVLLGGPIVNPLQAAVRTLELCRDLHFDDIVINVWAYSRLGIRPDDCHFSWNLVRVYGLESIMKDFLSLQPRQKGSIGSLVHIA